MSNERAPNTIDTKLGNRVRARRLEIGMSQERLADLLGITFQQVQKYEKGVNRIAASRLLDIGVALDKPAGSFFDGLGGAVKRDDAGGAIAASLATPEGARLAGLFARLKSGPLRRRVVNLVSTMADDA